MVRNFYPSIQILLEIIFPVMRSCDSFLPHKHTHTHTCTYIQRARATTKKIETPADLDGFPEMNDTEKQEIRQLIKEFVTSSPKKSPAAGKSPKAAAAKKKGGTEQPTLAFADTGLALKAPGNTSTWHVFHLSTLCGHCVKLALQ